MTKTKRTTKTKRNRTGTKRIEHREHRKTYRGGVCYWCGKTKKPYCYVSVDIEYTDPELDAMDARTTVTETLCSHRCLAEWAADFSSHAVNDEHFQD